MKRRKLIQLSITIGAILIAAAHLIWPNLSIDWVVAVLIIVAIIPWLSPLFKSLELPGGLKFEFQELEKVGKEAKEAGLLQENVIPPQKQDYSFLAIADSDPSLALTSLRIEIEKRLRKLAYENKIESSRKDIRTLIKDLSRNQLLTTEEKSTLEDMIGILNTAAHSEQFDDRVAQWVIENGPKILASLDGKLCKWVEARSSSSPFEMSAWGLEKSEHVLHSLAQLVDTIRTEYGNNPQMRDKLFQYIAPSIWDASKLYAFFNDADWQIEDRELILREGVQGFEKLKHRYNRA